MAEIMKKVGYKWLYDATRAKVSDKLQKEGADVKNIQKFFNKLDKKVSTPGGTSMPLAQAAFVEAVKDIYDAKKPDPKDGKTYSAKEREKLEAFQKKITSKVSGTVRFKSGAIILLMHGNEVVTVK
tara:strand:- start:34 stop:411 length:378 start_codon:yes stop_codon:yes gene_type:complete